MALLFSEKEHTQFREEEEVEKKEEFLLVRLYPMDSSEPHNVLYKGCVSLFNVQRAARRANGQKEREMRSKENKLFSLLTEGAVNMEV